MLQLLILPCTIMGMLISMITISALIKDSTLRIVLGLAAIAVWGIIAIVAYELTSRDEQKYGTLFECKTCGWVEYVRCQVEQVENTNTKCPICSCSQSTKIANEEDFNKYDVGNWWFLERDMMKMHEMEWHRTNEYKQRISSKEFINNAREHIKMN